MPYGWQRIYVDSCNQLKTLVLPSTLELLQVLACPNLQTIYYLGTEEQWNNVYKAYSADSIIYSGSVSTTLGVQSGVTVVCLGN